MSSLWRLFKGRRIKDHSTSDSTGSSLVEGAVEEPPYGLKLIAEGVDPVVDIVAIHGLNGHRDDTWTTSAGDRSINWLSDFLPQDVTHARIFAWGYDANTHGRGPRSQQFLENMGTDLAEGLITERRYTNTERRPIIFIAHSLGGLVLKAALLHSRSGRQGAGGNGFDRGIHLSTYGIFFIGTPHQGGQGVSLGKFVLNMASAFMPTNKVLLDDLSNHSRVLQKQADEYLKIRSDYVTKFMYEMYPTSLAVGKIVVVPKWSASVLGDNDTAAIGIHANHIDMVKFKTSKNNDYRRIMQETQLMIKDAQKTIEARWILEDKVNAVHTNSDVPTRRCIIPFGRNDNFVGRESEIDKIEQMLFGEQSKSSFALVGLGGIGKTQLALRFAYAIKDELQDCSVFWLSIASIERFENDCRNLCTELGINPASENEDPKAMMKRYFESEEAGRWLMILDNGDDHDVLFPGTGSQGIARYFPHSDQGRNLYTTRVASIGERLANHNYHTMVEFSNDEALVLLKKLWPQSDSSEHSALDMQQLVTKLEAHPLAITQAAAYLTRTCCALSTYMNLLNSTHDGAHELLSRGVFDEASGSPKAIATTWIVSFEQIQQHHTESAELLYFISFIEARAIPSTMLPGDENAEQKQTSIGILAEYAFLARRQGQEVYDMHPLVHLALAHWVHRQSAWSELMADFVSHMEDALIQTHDYSALLQYQPHAIALFNHSDKAAIPSKFGLLLKIGISFVFVRSDRQAVEWLERAKKETSSISVSDEYKLHLEYWLAVAYRSVAYYQQAVDIVQPILLSRNDQSEELIRFQRLLGTLYIRMGQTAEGIPLLERAQQSLEACGNTDERYLSVAYELAGAYLGSGRTNEAIEILERVVAVQSGTLADEHPNRLSSQHGLARAYLDSGRTSEGIEMLERVVAIRSRTLADEHPDRLSSQHELARAYLDSGRTSEAIEMLERVVAIQSRTLADEHPSRLSSQHGLARAYLDSGRTSEGIEMLERVVAIRSRTLADEHPDRLTSQHELARAYHNSGRTSEAIEMLEHVVTIQSRTLADEHPYRLVSQHALARAYLDSGWTSEAIEILELVVAVESGTLAEEDRSRLVAQQTLGSAYIDAGRAVEAIQLLQHVASITKRILPETDELRLDTEYWLAKAKRLPVKQSTSDESEWNTADDETPETSLTT